MTPEERRMELFYSGQDWLRFELTVLGRSIPRSLFRYFPASWIGTWKYAGGQTQESDV